MKRQTHQIFFVAIILNLLLVLLLVQLNSVSKILCILSLAAMVILPFGKKGGAYHIIVGSCGLILYFLSLTVES